MSGAEITITVDDASTAAILGQLAALMDDMTPVMDEIGGHLVASTQMRFEDGSGPGGIAWKPSLRVLLQGGQTLVDSGRLKASLTHDAGPKSVTVGTNAVYAAIHQFGGTIRAKTAKGLRFKGADGGFRRLPQVVMPARPFLGFDAEDRAAVTDIIAGHINRITGAAGAPTV
jgi:phage virion morphogenesis protein